jgi:peroxiredoxin
MPKKGDYYGCNSFKHACLGYISTRFFLPDTQGNMVSLVDFKEVPALLVIFMCNHCPFVKHILRVMVDLVKQYQAKGVAVVGINSNDVANFPDDSPEKMAKVAKKSGFTFPYIYDETQAVAKAYRAACTPDFFFYLITTFRLFRTIATVALGLHTVCL